MWVQRLVTKHTCPHTGHVVENLSSWRRIWIVQYLLPIYLPQPDHLHIAFPSSVFVDDEKCWFRWSNQNFLWMAALAPVQSGHPHVIDSRNPPAAGSNIWGSASLTSSPLGFVGPSAFGNPREVSFVWWMGMPGLQLAPKSDENEGRLGRGESESNMAERPEVEHDIGE